MTADIVNLRRARKAKVRAGREQQAAENRVRFGRSKAERQAQSISSERERRAHLGRELERGCAGHGTSEADPATTAEPETASTRDRSKP